MVSSVGQHPMPTATLNDASGDNRFYSRLCEVAEVVVQIAIRAAFIAVHILVTAAFFPVSWHWLVIPISGFGSAILAAFFFSRFIGAGEGGDSARLCSQNSLAAIDIRAQLPAHYPLGAPVGFRNLSGNDCSFNAVAHFLDSDPQLAQWMRQPLGHEMDLAQFLVLLNEYKAPRELIEGFVSSVEEEPAPKPSARQMFLRLLQNFPVADQDNERINRIKNIFEAHAVLNEFYKKCDEAVETRRAVSDGDSRKLRAALRKVNPLIPVGNVQVSAEEVVDAVIAMLPNRMKTWTERTLYCNENGLPQIIPEEPRVENWGLFPLILDLENRQFNLEQLIYNACNYRGAASVTRFGIDGVERSYPIERFSVNFTEPPPALRFSIQRGNDIFLPRGLWNQFLSYMHGNFARFSRAFLPTPLASHRIKLNDPIVCPEEISITLKNRQVCRYRLASFVTHEGEDNRGHYISGEIRGGHKYIENDSVSTLVETPRHQADWNEKLQQAYLLCYLPIAPVPE